MVTGEMNLRIESATMAGEKINDSSPMPGIRAWRGKANH
jgi:hypothetical protein